MPTNKARKDLNRVYGSTGAQDVDTEAQDRQLLVDDDGRTITKQANASGVIVNPATEETALRIAVSGEIMDDWDEGDRAKVNPIVGQAGVEAGAGATTAKTQRTATATDSPDAVSLSIIDDWDEADRAKVNPVVGQAGIEAGAGDATAKTTRIAIATDANAVDTGLLQPLTDAELRAAPVPVSGPVTDAEMRAAPVPVVGPLTDAELRATPVPVDTGLTTQLDALTDTELRAAPVPVSTGLTPLTDAQLRAAAVPVDTGLTTQIDALTDAELRAAPVPVATGLTPLTDAQLRATAVPVDTGLATQLDALTDAELRATPVPVDTGLTTQLDALTDAELRAAPVVVDTGLVTQLDALTDAELRAAPVPVSTGLTPLTDAQLRAAAVPVDVTDKDARILGRTKLLDSAGAVIDPATKASVDAVATSLGTDGAAPPSIAGTGVRGWLRAIYDFFVAGLKCIPSPFSAGAGRTHVSALLENQTADALLYTVTAGKTLYVTSIVFGMVNTSTGTNGRALMRDGTTTAGTGKLPFLSPPAGAGVLSSAVGNVTTPLTFEEPLQFTTGVFLDLLAGVTTYSISITGYEQ